jgi:hypothetical protein
VGRAEGREKGQFTEGHKTGKEGITSFFPLLKYGKDSL